MMDISKRRLVEPFISIVSESKLYRNDTFSNDFTSVMAITEASIPRVTIEGLEFHSLSSAQAIKEIFITVSRGRCRVYFCNIHTLFLASTLPHFKRVLSQGDYRFNDGVGLSISARMRHGFVFLDNLVGTDLVPRVLLEANKRALKIFAITSQERTKCILSSIGRQLLGQHFLGAATFRSQADSDRISREVAASGADVVLAGLGQPLQEFWIHEFGERTGARLLIGVGAFLDIVSGFTPRAPRWARNLKLEWAFRLLWEPRRLWKRYLIECPMYLVKTIAQ